MRVNLSLRQRRKILGFWVRFNGMGRYKIPRFFPPVRSMKMSSSKKTAVKTNDSSTSKTNDNNNPKTSAPGTSKTENNNTPKTNNNVTKTDNNVYETAYPINPTFSNPTYNYYGRKDRDDHSLDSYMWYSAGDDYYGRKDRDDHSLDSYMWYSAGDGDCSDDDYVP
ncbi:hypothetical protein Glove_132g72 [Diversispora epigaea]|uniref:Uncharacterized protein n=1 Tax=Diversispora epigaea TaxID=1348612 RepID=A0A397J6D0_9GLOM|nr:hypothetical protein Glove_132g72 [Diversispora epigaea]